MSVYRSLELPSKRQLGTWYVIGVGLAVTLGVLAYTLVAFESTLLLVIGAGLGLAILTTVGYLTYLLRSITVSDLLIWEVAQWTALGVALSTLLSLLIGFGRAYVPDAHVIAGLLVGIITGGSLLGAMLGVVSGLRSQHDRMADLTQRNTVLNRVLRHNIKNDMNVILGHTTLLEGAVDRSAAHHVDAIDRAAKNVTRLSQTARQIDRLTNGPDDRPIDAADTVETCIASIDDVYPEASFSMDLPDAAWADASSLLRPAVKNVLENAVEHNDGNPAVHVSVADEGEIVRIRVADDGPGIYEGERAVLDAGDEGPIRHGSGLGLWLVKWFVEQQDGELSFEPNDPRGTVVELSIPAAESPDSEETTDSGRV